MIVLVFRLFSLNSWGNTQFSVVVPFTMQDCLRFIVAFLENRAQLIGNAEAAGIREGID